LCLLAFTIKSIEEYDMDLMGIFHIIILFTEIPENYFTTIGRGITFNGFVKISPMG
jgi:hypothetical protein